jgi:DNA-binding Xre family transcriptional regulator
MKADRKKLELAMARTCMSSKELPVAAQLPRPTVQNVIVGKSVRPETLGKVAKALNCDPVELLEE